MDPMAKADRATGIAMLLFSLGVIAMASRMQMYAEFGPGEGFLPFWLGVAMAGLAALLFLNASRYRDGQESPWPKRDGLLRSGLTFLILVAYVLLLQLLGFVIPSILVIAVLMKAVGNYAWPKSLLISAAATAALYLIFALLLEVRLPPSLLNYPLGLPNGF